MRLHQLCTAIVLSSLTVSALAQSQGEHKDHHRGPPPEAIAACAGKAIGTQCSFLGREKQQLTGTCFAPKNSPDGQSSPPSACRPVHGKSSPTNSPTPTR